MDLFFRRGPSTVFWGIWTAIVYAIKRSTEWPLAHVSEKSGKGIPSLAYIYTPSAVVRISWEFRVIAALSHCLPRAVEWVRSAHSVRPPASATAIPLHASTCFFVSRAEAVSAPKANSSTVTSTFPNNRSALPSIRWPQGHKAGKSLASQIERSAASNPQPSRSLHTTQYITRHWEESKAIFDRLKAQDFAACMPLPVEVLA